MIPGRPLAHLVERAPHVGSVLKKYLKRKENHDIGLGNISILYRYHDMRLNIVLDFGYRYMVSLVLFLVLKAALQ